MEDVDIEKEFYAHLGLLSIQFARMEQMLRFVCSGLIGGDQFIAQTLINKNTLDTNLKLARKLNMFRRIDEQFFKDTLNEIDTIRRDRNRFIHGIWLEPYKTKGLIQITCREFDIVQNKDSKSEDISFYDRTDFIYSLEDIQMKILTVKEIFVKLSLFNDFIKKMPFYDSGAPINTEEED